ncbi:hypothetical protein Pyn_10846 [Prunus yedoensis var. nudiflora]|uniref:Uncharacterized protein n=1 Tax=Prunus yedoensis var. nudiflora TaxID=2094558 RepID=A0A314UQR1_PRUYE|nr:hypothetical protein Pyn_10846 [Prunus yedoensis var. nudiflora]
MICSVRWFVPDPVLPSVKEMQISFIEVRVIRISQGMGSEVGDCSELICCCPLFCPAQRAGEEEC